MKLNWDALLYRLRRRPVRVVEAIVALASLVGLVIDPSVVPHIVVLLTLIIGGGELAQTQTRPTVDDQAHENLKRLS